MPLAAVVTGANGTATVTASGGTTLVVEPVEFHPNTMGDDLIQTVQVKPGGSVLWKRPA